RPRRPPPPRPPPKPRPPRRRQALAARGSNMRIALRRTASGGREPPVPSPTGGSRPPLAAPRAGFTPLDGMLAMASGVVLLGALYVAVNVQLSQAQAGRALVQQSPLARSLCNTMSNDITPAVNLVNPARFRMPKGGQGGGMGGGGSGGAAAAQGG